MIKRQLEPLLVERLAESPAVVLLGPRQVGKTTLARAVAAHYPDALFLDLEKATDRAALQRPEMFLAGQRNRLVVLDEVQALPDLFMALRPEIDADRRPGRFLLLGSASGALLRQTAESLAGRVAYLTLPGLTAWEMKAGMATNPAGLQSLWLRGGLPPSALAPDDRRSFNWRQDFINTFLHRDLPGLGVRVPAETLRRFWQMLAHAHGQLFNASQLGMSLGGASHATTTRHLDTLTDALVARRLMPHLANVGKRLVKSHKVYLRDSGLLHALLGIETAQALQGHPMAGASWEGFVIEQIAAALPPQATLSFYRTAAGAELDLLVHHQGRLLAFEVKLSTAPKPTKGFWQALQDLKPDAAYVVAPVVHRYPLAEGVEVLPVEALQAVLGSIQT
jgi:predicted AAA+ superfamily ATPase